MILYIIQVFTLSVLFISLPINLCVVVFHAHATMLLKIYEDYNYYRVHDIVCKIHDHNQMQALVHDLCVWRRVAAHRELCICITHAQSAMYCNQLHK